MLFLALFICLNSKVAFSALTLTLQPLDYYNSGSKDYGGSCCDDFFCISDCDNWFKFCVTSFPVSDFSKCRLYAITNVLGDDNFHFPGYGRSLGTNVRTPFVIKLNDRWPGAFGLLTHVWDDDSGNFLGVGRADDFVDSYRMNVYMAAGRNERSVVEKRFYARGRRSSLGFLARAWCDKDFYGSDCFTHCVAQDSPSGHWTCDPATGSKVCMSGWWGHNCEKRMFLRLSESYDCYMFAICYIRT